MIISFLTALSVGILVWFGLLYLVEVISHVLKEHRSITSPGSFLLEWLEGTWNFLVDIVTWPSSWVWGITFWTTLLALAWLIV